MSSIIDPPVNAPAGQTLNRNYWWRHEVQSLSGANIGVSAGVTFTTILLIDARRLRHTSVLFYNQDGATPITVRVIGTIYDSGDDNPAFTSEFDNDVSWIDTNGEEICGEIVVAPSSHSPVITTDTPYAWILCQASASSATLVNGYYRGTN